MKGKGPARGVANRVPTGDHRRYPNTSVRVLLSRNGKATGVSVGELGVTEMTSLEARHRIQAALREALETQIREGNPPETRETFDRLRSAGIPEDNVWQMLGAALLTELNAARQGKGFDNERYVRRLQVLPQYSSEP